LYGNGYYPPWVYVPPPVFYPLPSPWNAAVAELRARGNVRSRDRFETLPPSTAAELRDLESRKAELYARLRAAPQAEKAELRAEWLRAREDLERARLLAARQLR